MPKRLRLDAPRDEQLVWFLQTCFGDQSGWLCLGWIDGDPKVEPLREEWYHLPEQLGAATERARALAERGYNLYVAPCLFTTRTRGYATALPSAWLWLDDVAIDGAALIESSPGNFQSWLPLDRPLGARERSQLQRALRDISAGADACSADAVHMARLPGGWNRKRHGAWQVRAARMAGPPHCVDQLRTRYPHARETTLTHGSDGDWGDLPHGDALAHSQRFQALARANSQLGQLLAGETVGLEYRGYHPAPRGRADRRGAHPARDQR